MGILSHVDLEETVFFRKLKLQQYIILELECTWQQALFHSTIE